MPPKKFAVRPSSPNVGQPKQFVVRPATQMQPGTITPAAQNPQVLQVNQGGGGGAPQGGKRFTLPQFPRTAGDTPQWGRAFVQSSGAIPVMWGVSMFLVAVDEWRTNHILARPARLWWTTIGFGILAVLAHFEKLAVIANLLAIGFTLQLAYQFFSKKGQFTQSGGVDEQ